MVRFIIQINPYKITKIRKQKNKKKVGKTNEDGKMIVLDCVPLFHTHILDPMLEFALIQV